MNVIFNVLRIHEDSSNCEELTSEIESSRQKPNEKDSAQIQQPSLEDTTIQASPIKKKIHATEDQTSPIKKKVTKRTRRCISSDESDQGKRCFIQSNCNQFVRKCVNLFQACRH